MKSDENRLVKKRRADKSEKREVEEFKKCMKKEGGDSFVREIGRIDVTIVDE